LKAKPKQIAKAGIGSSAADKAIEHDNHSAVTICASQAMDALIPSKPGNVPS
jgi:hypothetical protein